MIRRTRIGAIYRKELIDILRDRRTLMAMIVIPVVLYPLVMIGFVKAAESEEGRLQSETFVIEAEDQQTYEQLGGILREIVQNKESPDEKVPNLNVRIGHTPPRNLGENVHARVTIHVTDGHGRMPPRWNVEITYNEVNVRSRTAMQQLSDALDRFRELRTRQSLRDMLGRLAPPGAGTPQTADIDLILKPVEVKTVSTASERQRGGWALGQVVPLILVLMTITGAIYPAIDLTAGERERGTLETLMAAPVPVLHLILGKFLVVATVGMMTAALNVASVGATMHFSGLTKAISAEMPVQFPLSVLPIILLCLVPFALLFSAILVAVCSFARTFKEAQNYVMPVIIVSMIPAFAVALPTVRLEGVMLVLPVGNMVLLTRELFQQTYTLTQIAVVLLSTMLYAAAAVAAAARLFGQEAVMFADSRSYKAMLTRRFFVPSWRPSESQALLLAALLFPASFYAQSLLAGTSTEGFVRLLGWLAVVQFAGLFMVLPVALCIYFKIDIIATFRLRSPQAQVWLATVLIGSSSWALAHTFMSFQERWISHSRALEEFGRQIEAQLAGSSVWLVLLLMAVVPAVAEEFFFRGFLLSGMSSGLKKWSSICLVAVIFGIYHFMIDRLPVTAIMGVVLGYLCWQSRSILPGMFVHAMHNGSMIVLSHLPAVTHWMGIDGTSESAGGFLPARVLIPAAILFLSGIAIVTSLRSREKVRAAEPRP